MRIVSILAAALFAVSAAAAEPKYHRITKIAEDVYLFEATAARMASNSLVIVNQDEVFLVDTHNDASAAGQLADDIKTVFGKPVRTVVDTHFHFDHAGGNEVFARSAEIIGSVFAQHHLAHGFMGRRPSMFPVPADMQKAAEAAADMSVGAAKGKPTLVVKDKLVLNRGGREIQVIYPGRGHTGGDLIVFLPKERVVATGDFLPTGPACCGFPGDSYPVDYVKSLDVLKGLDFNTIVPGHGQPLSGEAAKARVSAYQSYLRDFWTQVEAFKKQGLTALEASKKLDLTAHKTDFPGTRGPADFTGDQPDIFVVRAYELLEGRDPYAKNPR